MKLFIYPKDLLNDNLTLKMRGILITMMLLKDDDSKLWLAKIKSKMNIKDIGFELNLMQKKGILKWSGFKYYENKAKEDSLLPKVREIILFINDLYSRNFSPNGSHSVLKTILSEGYSVDDCKLVVANRYSEWKDDTISSKWLNTATPFRKKMFPVYLEEAKRTRIGENFLVASNNNLKDGDEITFDNSRTFIDKDTYNLLTYRVDEEGDKRGVGLVGVRYGKDIKKTLKVQNDAIRRGEKIEFIYIYKTR